MSRLLFLFGLVIAAVAGLGPLVIESQLHDAPDAAYADVAADYPEYLMPVDAEPLTGTRDPRVVRQPGEAVLTYVERVTDVVGSITYHCDYTNAGQTWETALLNRVSGGAYPGNQGVIYLPAYRCGFCHQTSLVLAQVLRDNGIPSADAYGLQGHVVTTFTYDGSEWATDADLGADPMRVDWDDPAQLRESVGAAYRDASGDWTVDQVAAVYVDSSDDVGRYEAVLPQWTGYGVEALAAHQGRFITYLSVSRWILVSLGCLMVMVASTRLVRNRAA